MTKFQVVLATIVTVAWIVSIFTRTFGNGSVTTDYTVLDSVVLLVFGFIFSASAVRKKTPTAPAEKETPK